MATNDPRALLDRLLKQAGEVEWLEFKENNADPDMIGRTVAALANAAILVDRDRAFMVWGVENKTKAKVGTDVRLAELTKGGENFSNWLTRLIEPRLMMEFLDFEEDGKKFSILCVEPTYDRPVRFSGTEYVRIGENVRPLRDLPNHERALWMATGRRTFESAIALPHQSPEEVLEKLDAGAYYRLREEVVPTNKEEIIRRLAQLGCILEDMEGGFDITNLGAVLFAADLSLFPSVSNKAVRLIKYSGVDKRNSEEVNRPGFAGGRFDQIYAATGMPSSMA